MKYRLGVVPTPHIPWPSSRTDPHLFTPQLPFHLGAKFSPQTGACGEWFSGRPWEGLEGRVLGSPVKARAGAARRPQPGASSSFCTKAPRAFVWLGCFPHGCQSASHSYKIPLDKAGLGGWGKGSSGCWLAGGKWLRKLLALQALVLLCSTGFAPRGGFQVHIRRGHAVFPSEGQGEGTSSLQSAGAGLTSEAFLGVT